MSDDANVTANPWQALRRFTAARIALGRAGVSMPTAPQLVFQLAHAQARDAVHRELDADALAGALTAALALPCVVVHSAAENRANYLRRPDLGRRLDGAARAQLAALAALAARAPHSPPSPSAPAPGLAPSAPAPQSPQSPLPVPSAPSAPYDIGFVIADGLSALAIEQHALPFLRSWLSTASMTMAPLVIVRQGRVAVGDEVAQLLGVPLVVVMIGERPGLSSPDSMGLYLTWQPQVGLTDERRNCISNVRPAGLDYDAAARKLHHLVAEARRRGFSGVALKDTSDDAAPEIEADTNFLLPGAV